LRAGIGRNGSGGRLLVVDGVSFGARTTQLFFPARSRSCRRSKEWRYIRFVRFHRHARWYGARIARLPAARRRRQLLDVALHVFAEKGFHVTSMTDIADAAGVTKPVLYQHFASKRALYRELLDDVGAQLLEAITKATTAATGPREQVELGFGAYFGFVDERREAFQILFGGGARRDAEFASQVAELEAAIADAIAALIDVEGLDEDERRLLAHGIVGLAEGTSRHWLGEAIDADPDHLARRTAALAWRGLRGL
jgi:AcrR family transcriptional regulator